MLSFCQQNLKDNEKSKEILKLLPKTIKYLRNHNLTNVIYKYNYSGTNKLFDN